MEEGVWLVFGVIAVVIGFVIIANIVSLNKDETRIQEFERSMELVRSKCNYVCDSPIDTYSSVDVPLPSGLKIITNENRVCGQLNISADYSDINKCIICDCDVTLVKEFDLQTDVAKKSFSMHDYSCFFKRLKDEVEMECKG